MHQHIQSIVIAKRGNPIWHCGITFNYLLIDGRWNPFQTRAQTLYWFSFWKSFGESFSFDNQIYLSADDLQAIFIFFWIQLLLMRNWREARNVFENFVCRYRISRTSDERKWISSWNKSSFWSWNKSFILKLIGVWKGISFFVVRIDFAAEWWHTFRKGDLENSITHQIQSERWQSPWTS